MIGQISEHLIQQLERIVGLPADAKTPRLRRLIGLGSDRCNIALFRRLDYESLERRTMLSADLGFAFDAGSAQDDVGYQVATDNVGNIYITGEFQGTVDFDPGAGVTNLTSNGGSDVFIAKYDDLGQLLWAESIGGTGDDKGLGLTVDGNGKVYLTGIYSGTIDFDPGADTDIKIGGTQDAFVLKLDTGGAYVWSTTFVSTGDVSGYDLAVNGAGEVYAAGGFTGTTDFDPSVGAVAPVASNGGSDAYLTKIDSSGTVLWVETFGGGQNDAILGIDLDSSGNIVTTGYFASSVDFDPGGGATNLVSGGGTDAFVSKLDANGNFLWVFGANGTSDNFGRDIVVDSNDNIIFTGSFESNMILEPGGAMVNLGSAGGSDIYVAKLNSTGDLVWAQQFGGTGDDIAYAIDVDSLNNVLVAGEFRGTVDFDPDALDVVNRTAAGNYAAFVTKFDAGGDLYWAATTEGTGDVTAYGIAADGSDRILTAGSLIGTADMDPAGSTYNLVSAGNADLFVAALLSNTTPTTSGIATVNLTENDPDTVIDLFAAFDDGENADSDLTYTLVGNTNPGLFASLIIDGVAGTLTLDLAGNTNGTAVMTLRATDQSGEFVETSFTVNVAATNDQPTTSGIGDVVVVEDAANSLIDLFDAFADMEDSDAALTYTITGNSNPSLFSAINLDGAAGTLTLNYAANAFGSGVIRVRATDTGGKYVETTFNVTVTPENDQPTTVGIGNITVVEDTAASYVNLFDAFADVEDPDTALVYSVSGNTNSGLFSGISVDGQTGTLILNYAADQFGTADITVRARDIDGLFVETTFTVTVNPQNDAPVADSDAYRLWQDSHFTSQVSVLNNDSDVEADAVLAKLVAGPAHGNLYLAADGTFTYIPAAGYYGIDQFTYAADDGSQLSLATTVTLSVARLPLAADDRYVAIANIPLSIAADGVLKNDTVSAGGTADAVLVDGPQHGAVELQEDGSFLYIPDADFVGSDSFRYRLESSGANSWPAVVTIEVVPLPTVFNEDEDTGIDNPFDTTNDLIDDPAVEIVITNSGLSQSSASAPLAYYANELEATSLGFGGSGISAADFDYYSGAGGGKAETVSGGHYQLNAHAELNLSEAESGGGGEDLVADGGPLQLRINSLAVPVDDDLLLNSAYLEGDESAYVFDRIIQKSTTAHNEGEGQREQKDGDLELAADTNPESATQNEAEAPWQRPAAQLPADAVDEVWADPGEFLIHTQDGLFAAGSADEAQSSQIDQGVLAVIATTIAAGQISKRSKAALRKSALPPNGPPSSPEDPQR